MKYGPAYLFISLFLLTLTLSTCSGEHQTDAAASFDYGTESDSARYYFNEGWREIMDNGRWTESEMNFRKAMSFDQDWPIGKSLVGRITRDLAERQQLLKELEKVVTQVSADEALLLDIFMPGMVAMNNRDQAIQTSAEDRTKRRALSEKDFRSFVHKHPTESYIMAEYIETLHANHGAKTALDSLNKLASDQQKNLPFYISYAATLELELGHLEAAQKLSDQLSEVITDESFTSPLMLQAQILMSQDSLEKASILVNKVVAMDANHLIAVGMKRRIDKALADQ